METIARRKLSDEVRERLVDAIETGEYPPGSKLPSERDLMARWQVGRPAIREAMQTLQNMGLIRISHGERARVILPTAETVIDQISGAMVQLLAGNTRGLNDLKEARTLFEVGLVRLATQRATGASLESLRQALNACREARDDQVQFVAADMAFHHQIAAMSGNALITAVSHGMLDWLMRFKRDLVSVKGADRITLDEHERIFKAIASGSADAAAVAMREHLTRANELYSIIELQQGRSF